MSGELDIWTDSPKAREYMQTEIITFVESDDSWKVIRTLLEHKLTGAPVVDDEGRLIGMISEKDLMSLMAKGSPIGLPRKRVSEMMVDSVVTIPPDMNVFTLASLFRHNPYHRFPVVEDGKLIGLIGRADMLRCMVDIGKL